jgi:hypothetical protein
MVSTVLVGALVISSPASAEDGWPQPSGWRTPESDGSAPANLDGTTKRKAWQWTDDEGNLHVTEDPGKIPAAYKKKAIERDLRKGIPSLGGAQEPPNIEFEPTEERAKIEGPQSPEFWRATQERLIAQYRNLLGEIDVLAEQIQRLRATGQPPERVHLAIEALHEKVDVAHRVREDLMRLKERCRSEGGNDAWVDSWADMNLPEPPDIRF